MPSSPSPVSSTQSVPFEAIEILGTRFHKLRVQDLIRFIVAAGQGDRKTLVANVNVHAMNFAQRLSWYREFINQADLVFCDGFGVLLGAKLCGCQLESCHRMTCPDYIEALAKACEQGGVSLYLLAGKPGVTDQAIAKLQAIAPNLRIAGHHGFFAKTGSENDQIIEQINQFNPDVLYVGFGMPLQEQWIANNFSRINTRVFLPLGACLDFYTGTVYRGPQWMTDRGLEWLSRLFTEPQRLWDRYLVGNTVFLSRVVWQNVAQKLGRSR